MAVNATGCNGLITVGGSRVSRVEDVAVACERVIVMARGRMVYDGEPGALAVAAWVFYTGFPLGALYGAFQAALFYTVVSMSLAALFKSEASGSLVVAALLFLNGLFTGFGANQIRISPFWNPAAVLKTGAAQADVLAWTIQNRIGFLFAITVVIAMGFTRAERREKLL